MKKKIEIVLSGQIYLFYFLSELNKTFIIIIQSPLSSLAFEMSKRIF